GPVLNASSSCMALSIGACLSGVRAGYGGVGSVVPCGAEYSVATDGGGATAERAPGLNAVTRRLASRWRRTGSQTPVTAGVGQAAGADLAIQHLGPVSVLAIHQNSLRALLHTPHRWYVPMKWLSHTGSKALQAGSYLLQLFGLPRLRMQPDHLGGRWLSGIGS